MRQKAFLLNSNAVTERHRMRPGSPSSHENRANAAQSHKAPSRLTPMARLGGTATPLRAEARYTSSRFSAMLSSKNHSKLTFTLLPPP